MRFRLIRIAAAAFVIAGFTLLATWGSTLYYAAGHGSNCANCHEMAASVDAMHASPHGNAQCADCHEATVSDKLRHVRVHIFSSRPDGLHLRESDVRKMMVKCQG